MEITLTTTIDIPDSVLEDVLTTAVEGGINYWAAAGNLKRRGQGGPIESVTIHDLDEDETYYLNAMAIGQGIIGLHEAIMSGRYSPTCEVAIGFLSEINDLGAVDATVADAIVQMACFGEIVYG